MPEDHQLALTEHLPDDPDATGPLVVLVHGSLDRAGSFARVTRRLGDLHTIAYDRHGYHRSRGDRPVHDTLDGHIDDLLAVVDGRPAVVIGHSYGGDHRARCRHAHRGPGPDPRARRLRAPAAVARRMGHAAAARRRGRSPRPADEDPADVAERFFRRMVGDTAWERLPEAAKAARRSDGAALAAELAAIRVDRPPFDVASLAVPAVFGRGTASLPHHRDAVTWLHEHVAGSGLVEIEGAGHGAHLTHPDAFAGFVRAAVARAPGAGTPVVAARWEPTDG